MTDNKVRRPENGKTGKTAPAPWNAPTARREGGQGRTGAKGEAGDGRADSSDPKMHAARF